MAKVELKKPVVEEISANIKDAQSVVLVTYCGIDVAADTALRKELRDAGITYKVYKNTMMNFAFKGTEFDPLCKHLEGPNAIAISKDDVTAPARIIAKYAKTAPALKMIAGVVEGKYYDETGVAALATVPSREELLGKLLGSIQSPITNLARVLNQIAEAKEA
ncbi:MAG: 50S ribosomal protein L10 [Lachnospiraceae bacterium]|nr:50S ribosomal protein L10 [Lachnospiraceae bacterium]MDD3795672.1 50S ribosomal protein L10 [Lachnospiraceae bacterium]